MPRSWILIFAATLAYGQAVVIRTSTLLDGKGHVLKNTDLVIEGGRITRIGAARGKPSIDLTGMTVMPGWIDTHVHATWYFNRDGRLEQGGRGAKSTPQQAALLRAKNCDEVQGYLYGRPMRAAEFIRHVQSRTGQPENLAGLIRQPIRKKG